MQPAQQGPGLTQMAPQSMVSVQMAAQAMMPMHASSPHPLPLLLPSHQCHIVPTQGPLTTSSPGDGSYVCHGHHHAILITIVVICHCHQKHHCDYECNHMQALAHGTSVILTAKLDQDCVPFLLGLFGCHEKCSSITFREQTDGLALVLLKSTFVPRSVLEPHAS